MENIFNAKLVRNTIVLFTATLVSSSFLLFYAICKCVVFPLFYESNDIYLVFMNMNVNCSNAAVIEGWLEQLW